MIYDPERSGAEARRADGLSRVLAMVAVALVFVIAAGTVIGLAAGTRQRKLERESRAAEAGAAGGAVFESLGTIRAKSADPKPAVVVATIAFPYDAGDGAFAEELARKAPALKAAAISCLSRKKAAELAPMYEGALKAALRDAFNGLLSLGEVEEVWLSDFAVIE